MRERGKSRLTPASPLAGGLVWALVAGCDGKEPIEQPVIEHELPQPIDVQTTGGTPSTRPDFECFSELFIDDQRNGVVDGYGFDGYDPAHPDWLLYSERDSTGNGIIDYLWRYERDANGNILRQQRERSGAETTERTYDERNNLLTERIDYGSDGLIDYLLTYSWDANDALLRYERDNLADGTPNYIVDYERTPEGLPTVALEDSNGDGQADKRFSYTYDEVDRTASVTIDEGIDEVIDAVLTYTYTDPVLKIGSAAYDTDNDGTPDQIDAFEHDENGRELYGAVDTDVDGTWDEERFTTYNAEGQILTYDEGGLGTSGPYTLQMTYAYDALGRMVQSTLYYVYAGQVIYNEQQDITFGGTCP